MVGADEGLRRVSEIGRRGVAESASEFFIGFSGHEPHWRGRRQPGEGGQDRGEGRQRGRVWGACDEVHRWVRYGIPFAGYLGSMVVLARRWSMARMPSKGSAALAV